MMRILRRREKRKKEKRCGHLVVVAKDVAVGLGGNHFVHSPLQDIPVLSVRRSHLIK